MNVQEQHALTAILAYVRGPDAEWEVTFPEFILPYGSGTAYSVDHEGNVVGLKLAQVPSHNPGELIDALQSFSRLQRLVLAFAEGPVVIPESLFNLKNLRYLYLAGSITTIPAAILKLDLDFIDSEEHPLRFFRRPSPTPQSDFGLWGLEALLHRYESPANSITPDEKPPIALEELRARLRAIEGIEISSSNLEDPPPEILNRGREALIHYYQELASGLQPLNELKVILVGMGGSGKTSLVKRLLGEPFDPHENQTHGINIRTRTLGAKDVGDVKLHFWDFGGQEIMHATHQFFLSKRSLYLLVLDGRKEEDPEYWLQLIESFGGDSPILVVINKIDEHPSFDVNRRFLLQKYTGVRDFFRVSCRANSGVERLRKALEMEIGSVPILRTLWPRDWFEVKRKLEIMRAAYITLERYHEICAVCGVADLESRETLVDFLHDLGIVLHFKEMELLDTHVLDPRWVTEAVYRIITSDILARQKGILKLKQLREALKKRGDGSEGHSYAPEKHQYIVDLMLKFELCYRISNSAILVPDLLGIQEPEVNLDSRNPIRFVFAYNYLPKSVILRFIVRMHEDIKGEMRWRTGVVLEDQTFSAMALVRADEKAKRISVYVGGEQSRDYFSVIRKVIRDINSSFEKLDVNEQVPLPDAPEVVIDYGELIGHEVAGRSEIFIGRLGRSYDVAHLLNGLERRENRSISGLVVNVHGDVVGWNVGGSHASTVRQVKTGSPSEMSYQPREWEKVVAYSTGMLFVVLIGYLVIRNEPFADPNLVVLLRIVLSLSVALLGATIPGILKVDFSAKGLTIRAIGALALFVIAFLLTPKVL